MPEMPSYRRYRRAAAQGDTVASSNLRDMGAGRTDGVCAGAASENQARLSHPAAAHAQAAAPAPGSAAGFAVPAPVHMHRVPPDVAFSDATHSPLGLPQPRGAAVTGARAVSALGAIASSAGGGGGGRGRGRGGGGEAATRGGLISPHPAVSSARPAHRSPAIAITTSRPPPSPALSPRTTDTPASSLRPSTPSTMPSALGSTAGGQLSTTLALHPSPTLALHPSTAAPADAGNRAQAECSQQSPAKPRESGWWCCGPRARGRGRQAAGSTVAETTGSRSAEPLPLVAQAAMQPSGRGHPPHDPDAIGTPPTSATGPPNTGTSSSDDGQRWPLSTPPAPPHAEALAPARRPLAVTSVSRSGERQASRLEAPPLDHHGTPPSGLGGVSVVFSVISEV